MTYGHAVVIKGAPQILDDAFFQTHTSISSKYGYRIPVYDSNSKEERYIYVYKGFDGVNIGSDQNTGLYGINANASAGGAMIYRIDAYTLKPDSIISIEEKIKNNVNNLFEESETGMEFDIETEVKISNSEGKTVSFGSHEIDPKEGDLECQVFPAVGITEDGEGRITKNNISLGDEDWYSIETENDTDKLNANIQFGDSYMKVLTQAGGKAEFENKKSVKLSNYSGQEYEMKLTLNDEFQTLPWYTISVNGTGTKEAKLEMVENGAVISGDDLKNIIVKGNDSKETVELGVSTDKDKVLITANNDETKLLAYIDTDGDGSFETLLEDGKENLNNNQNKTEEKTNQKENITNAQTGDQIVLMVITLLVAVIALACTVIIKHIIE